MQRNLLDTHALIWYINGDPELSQAARTAIEADNTISFVSIASLREMAIKISLGKPELKTPFNQIGRQIKENGFEVLPVTFEYTLTFSTLPFHHRGPFDRILLYRVSTTGWHLFQKIKTLNFIKQKSFGKQPSTHQQQ